MMRKQLLTIFLASLLGLAGCVTATTTPTAASEPTAITKPRPLAYTVTVPSEPRPRHVIFGTIHVGVDARRELPAEVWDAFRNANCYVMEADQDAIDVRELMAVAKAPPGKGVGVTVKPEIYAKIAQRLGQRVGTLPLADSAPWFAALAYLQTLAPKGVAAMDGVFLAEARRTQKSIVFLESWRDAVVAFAGVTGPEDLEDLVESEAENVKELKDLIAAYRAGDSEAIESAIRRGNARVGGAESARVKQEALLDGRNRKWMPGLMREMRVGGNCFIAVGAGHLVGEAGLLATLRTQGFVVK